MANPGKIYNLPCQLFFEYAGTENHLIMMDKIKLGKREYQINGTVIDVD
jgi:hypothetical protein